MKTGSVTIMLLALSVAALPAQNQQRTALVADSGRFLLNGKPYQIISGEMHYPRVPREYWRDRMKKARAMGLNTISTYVFWNYHEDTPGHYDFSGQRDVAEYVRMAQKEGLHVILRPGPYVCAEWDLGGLPAWLFADSGVVLRSTDPRYTVPAARWLDRLGKELAPLLASHGGPIIAVQVENEYGSFDKDKAYMAWERDALKHAGFGDVLLYTADGDVQLKDGTLPDLPAVVNFGPGEADSAFARLQRFRPAGPMMSGEYWAGWFDQWGAPHHTTNVARESRELGWMLDRGYSVNLYMFHGGSTPGFMNGANIDGRRYHPQTSSYDYDAPLDESGRPSAKYFAFRDVIAKRLSGPLPKLPPFDSLIAIPEFKLTAFADFASEPGKSIRADRPRSMEMVGQSYGYILYHATLPAGRGQLVIHDVRDYAAIYLNGAPAGELDRRLGQDSLLLDVRNAGTSLDILVENNGRVNFAKPLRDEQKGITKSVWFAGKEVTGWDISTMPLSVEPRPKYVAQLANGRPAFSRGTFKLTRTGDTYLDMSCYTKGIVWVNGHNLGRYWSIGPQQSLFIPGPWLKKGTNEVVVFNLNGTVPELRSGKTPVFSTGCVSH